MKSELVDGIIDLSIQIFKTVRSAELLTQLCHRESVKMSQGKIICDNKAQKKLTFDTATAFLGGRKIKMRTFIMMDGSVYVYPMGRIERKQLNPSLKILLP